ncbi:MAG: DUF494 family protein [Ignavibacteriales bacterium]|nr:DUF494 family protein [Ignavibacteriales bacterium]
MFLVNELRSSKQLNDVDVALLTRSGYTQSEISTAFTWLFEHLSIAEGGSREGSLSTSTSFRILSEPEKMVIQPESLGYLYQIHHMGLLDANDVELIIDRIMAAGFGSVGIDEMKSLVAGVLFSNERSSKLRGGLSIGGNDTSH